MWLGWSNSSMKKVVIYLIQKPFLWASNNLNRRDEAKSSAFAKEIQDLYQSKGTSFKSLKSFDPYMEKWLTKNPKNQKVVVKVINAAAERTFKKIIAY
jgi:hypothetical protein